jgi:Spy/CpxP family protein refolding chaperone
MLTRAIVMLVVLAGGASAGLAQTADPGAAARGRAARPAGEGLNPGEVVRLLDGWAVMEAQKTLELSDEQYGQFVTRLRRLQETRRQSQRERNRLLQELRRMVGPRATGPVDEAALRERLKALRDLDERAQADTRKAYEAVEDVLDPRQQARFRLFEEMIEVRKLDLLVRARERAARARDGGGD